MFIGREQALSAARTLVGLSGTPAIAAATSAGERTPFLGAQMAALGQAWELTWREVRLALPSARGQADRYSRTVVVRLAQSSGQLLGATLRAAQLGAGVRPIPEGEVAQQQLRRAAESYKGLPGMPPRQTLVGALDAVFARAGVSPLQASEIQVLYVMHSRGERPAIPAWVVTLNGIPPLRHHGPPGADVPVWQRNHLRIVIDAVSGQPLFSTTIPQPIAPAPLLVS
jgi:hypothetical protein